MNYTGYDDDILSTAIVAFLVMFITIFIFVGVNSCSAGMAENGTVVDKYRSRYGYPNLVIENNNDYITFQVSEKDYQEYDIGEIYAQE